MIITHCPEVLVIPFQSLLGGQKPTIAWWNEDLLLRYLICCAWIVDGNSLTLHKHTHKHDIALVDQSCTRPTFDVMNLCVLLVNSLNIDTLHLQL